MPESSGPPERINELEMLRAVDPGLVRMVQNRRQDKARRIEEYLMAIVVDLALMDHDYWTYSTGRTERCTCLMHAERSNLKLVYAVSWLLEQEMAEAFEADHDADWLMRTYEASEMERRIKFHPRLAEALDWAQARLEEDARNDAAYAAKMGQRNLDELARAFAKSLADGAPPG